MHAFYEKGIENNAPKRKRSEERLDGSGSCSISFLHTKKRGEGEMITSSHIKLFTTYPPLLEKKKTKEFWIHEM